MLTRLGLANVPSAGERVDPELPKPWNEWDRWLVVHGLSLAAAVPALLWVNRDQWFTADVWTVITTRGLGSSPQRLSVFYPHFEHWTTIPILVYRALYSLFALRTYLPYTLVLIVAQVTAAHLLWRLLLRTGVQRGFATGLAAVFAVLAIGWENLSSAWQITIVAPVAFGFAALLVMPERGGFGRRDALCAAFLVVGLMCSGVGVTMTLVVGIAAFLRRGWRVAAATVAVPVVVYLVWLLTEGTKGQRSGVPLGTALGDLPSFVWNGLTEAVEGLTRIGRIGPIVVVLLAAWLAWRARPRADPWPLVLAMSAGAVISLALTGVRRAGADPGTSRYAYVVVVLLIPALALAVQQRASVVVHRVGRRVVVVFAGLIVALLVAQFVALDHYVETAFFSGEMRPRVLATAMLLRAHEPLISTNIFGIWFLPEPSTATIARFDRNGELPGTGDITEADVLTAREYVQMVIGSTGMFAEGKVSVAGTTHARLVATGEPGCVRASPSARPASVTIAFPIAASLRLETDRAWDVSMQLEADDMRGRPRFVFAQRGNELALSLARGDIDLVLGLPPHAAMTLCGLAM